jgi:hypothetical protein
MKTVRHSASCLALVLAAWLCCFDARAQAGPLSAFDAAMAKAIEHSKVGLSIFVRSTQSEAAAVKEELKPLFQQLRSAGVPVKAFGITEQRGDTTLFVVLDGLAFGKPPYNQRYRRNELADLARDAQFLYQKAPAERLEIRQQRERAGEQHLAQLRKQLADLNAESAELDKKISNNKQRMKENEEKIRKSQEFSDRVDQYLRDLPPPKKDGR